MRKEPEIPAQDTASTSKVPVQSIKELAVRLQQEDIEPWQLGTSNEEEMRIELTDSIHDISKYTLLHEYKDLFIDMDVRNNRSELAIANRHQER